MKSLAIYTVLILSSFQFCAQINAQEENEIENWLGEWEGELLIESTVNPTQRVKMQVRHFKTDTLGTYGWYLIYGDDPKTGTRAYYLKTKDEAKGHYILDEKNGIFLDTYLAGNKMLSSFDVEGSLITSVYSLQANGDLIFEIFFGSSKDPNLSGGMDDIPLVNSYKMGGFQRALLKKTSN